MSVTKKSIKKLIQLNKTLEELEIKTQRQKQHLETFLSSTKNLETNDIEINISISLYAELADDPFYANDFFDWFLMVYDKNRKGYYMLEKEVPNQSFCATLICLKEYAGLTLQQILSTETVWYEIKIYLQNTNDNRFQNECNGE